CNANANNTALHPDPTPPLTIYLPRRPATLPLAISATLTGAVVWITVTGLAPAYRLATLITVPQYDRDDAVHQLTVTAALTTGTLLLAAASLSIWLVAYSRYRLRRASCDQVTSGAPASTRRVRPPNPVTAATWVLLLLTTSTSAWWWIVPHLNDAASNRSDAAAPLHNAIVGALAWLAIVLLCTAGLTTWTSREARHRLRRAATTTASR
ncbi:MAG: hypothetical protein PSX37_14180, partial [bacterium]|nr:hypothetical protein [bacterium]